MNEILCIISNWLSAGWWLGLWTSLNTVALVLTLFFVYRYTKATKQQAEETASMVKQTEALAASNVDMVRLQGEEIGLMQRPIVSFGCRRETWFPFLTEIWNFGTVHAKAQVLATVEVNGRTLKLTPNHHYNGVRVWSIQARGATGKEFGGHLGFHDLMVHNGFETPEELILKPLKARVTIDSWVINLNDSDSSLKDDRNKNPTVQWYWVGRWIPEVCPVEPGSPM